MIKQRNQFVDELENIVLFLGGRGNMFFCSFFLTVMNLCTWGLSLILQVQVGQLELSIAIESNHILSKWACSTDVGLISVSVQVGTSLLSCVALNCYKLLINWDRVPNLDQDSLMYAFVQFSCFSIFYLIWFLAWSSLLNMPTAYESWLSSISYSDVFSFCRHYTASLVYIQYRKVFPSCNRR